MKDASVFTIPHQLNHSIEPDGPATGPTWPSRSGRSRWSRWPTSHRRARAVFQEARPGAGTPGYPPAPAGPHPRTAVCPRCGTPATGTWPLPLDLRTPTPRKDCPSVCHVVRALPAEDLGARSFSHLCARENGKRRGVNSGKQRARQTRALRATLLWAPALLYYIYIFFVTHAKAAQARHGSKCSDSPSGDMCIRDWDKQIVLAAAWLDCEGYKAP